jgi:hypothetical protein
VPESQFNAEERQKGALLIAASLIAAIRLRGQPIDNSPKTGTIHDALKLARNGPSSDLVNLNG